mmetsp:Transcript_27638/g.24475  ORF Transcript_27638/g.24475 Transcript_27638/m.24475 type:complete len:86 (+) Transcript_27638:242-499(+)
MMIENTDTLSELSRTIDDMNLNNGGLSVTNNGLYSSKILKNVDESLDNFENHISKIEQENDSADQLSDLVEEEDNKLVLNTSQEI